MALPKWTEERTASLTGFVGSESPISQATVAAAAEDLETSTRSVSSKLRKMGYDVELASSVSNRTFTDEQEATLHQFVTDNSGQYTYAEIASSAILTYASPIPTALLLVPISRKLAAVVPYRYCE